jgi:hypothetical protein
MVPWADLALACSTVVVPDAGIVHRRGTELLRGTVTEPRHAASVPISVDVKASLAPPVSIEVDAGVDLVKREIDAEFWQANWPGRVGSVPVPRLLIRFAPERTE